MVKETFCDLDKRLDNKKVQKFHIYLFGSGFWREKEKEKNPYTNIPTYPEVNLAGTMWVRSIGKNTCGTMQNT